MYQIPRSRAELKLWEAFGDTLQGKRLADQFFAQHGDHHYYDTNTIDEYVDNVRWWLDKTAAA